MNDVGSIRQQLEHWTQVVRDCNLDGWLIADFRWNNPLFARMLGLQSGILSRRCFLWLPAHGAGEPLVIASRVDGHTVAAVDCAVKLYAGFDDMRSILSTILPSGARVAMEYVPMGTLPTVSRVDGGLLELVRDLGVQVMTSGTLIASIEVWNERQRHLHQRAAAGVDEARRLALAWVREQLVLGQTLREGDVAAFISRCFDDRGLSAGGVPDVGVNANAADPHYTTSGGPGSPVERDAVLLIDLWARVADAAQAPYADSTWMAFTGVTPPMDVQRDFAAVREARDVALETIAAAARNGVPVAGRLVDRAARQVFERRGVLAQCYHRTGHSLGVEHVHGMGANLDDVEFPDDRPLLVHSGFTVEPGLYWPGRYGIRMEVSAILLPDGPLVTTERQQELTLLDVS